MAGAMTMLRERKGIDVEWNPDVVSIFTQIEVSMKKTF